MFHREKLKKLYEARLTEAKGDLRQGGRVFVNELRTLLGITEDVHGRPCLEATGRASPREFSIKELGRAIMGLDLYEDVYVNGGGQRAVLEAATGAIDPSAFQNINTFTMAVTGLLDAGILEGFNQPTHIGENFVTVRPTKKNGEKLIGMTDNASEEQDRKPGQAHARVGFGEHYAQTPELVEKGLACELTQEVFEYDLTGEAVDRANSVGKSLAYGKEKAIARGVLGVTNPYKYNGTAYNTYQTATPWINDHVNEFEDHTDITAARSLFNKMTDPATGREIEVMPTTILHSPDREPDFDRILNSIEVRHTTNTSNVTISNNPVKSKYTTYFSQIWHNVAQAASPNGLALTETQANGYWWLGDFKKAFLWMEGRPLRTQQASPSDYVMIDRGIQMAVFANYKGVFAVHWPQYVVRNKKS